MLPAFDSGEDLLGIGGPNEWLGVVVGVGEEAVYGGLQFWEGSKHAPLEAPSRELGEEAFDGIEPGRRGRVKWNVQRGCRANHSRTLGCLWVA